MDLTSLFVPYNLKYNFSLLYGYEKMTKRTKSSQKDLPGTIYQNKNRYWWKVQLPGEDKPRARPLKPVNSKYATTDYGVAVECAKIILQMSIFNSGQKHDGRIDSVASLVHAYHNFAKAYYTDSNGKISREPDNIRYACNPLLELFATCPLEEFGPLKLEEVQNKMIKLNWSRGVINQRIGMLKRMFKWAVKKQLVSPIMLQGLITVEGLRRGRSSARETKRVKPVNEEHIYGVLPYTTPVIAVMIELQLLTGMRPGELVLMKPGDIDRSEKVWHYFPERHKNEYRGIERIVSIGPRGQEILTAFLLRKPDAYCFSPQESETYRRAKMTEQRGTPLSCGNRVGTNRKGNPERSPGNKYDSHSYGKAVRRAIVAARVAIRKQGGIPDKELPFWTPYRMRHTAATKVRKWFGYESAGATLGHSNMSATAIYAERNQGLADDVARQIG
jgi:integrase